MNGSYNFLGFLAAVHPAPHADEWFVLWMMIRFSGLSPKAFVHFADTDVQIAALYEPNVCVGIGGGEFDEHARNGRLVDRSAANQAVGKLDLWLRPEVIAIMAAIHEGDVRGDQHPFNIDALLKPITQLYPGAHELHRELGVWQWIVFDILAGYEFADYPAINKWPGPESVNSCTDADQVFEIWKQVAAAHYATHRSCTEAIKHIHQLWHDQKGTAQLLHIRMVCHYMLTRLPPSDVYSFMAPLLQGFMEKQLDITGDSRCHHEWKDAFHFIAPVETHSLIEARRHTVRIELGVAVVQTKSPFVLAHLRRRRDIMDLARRPDVVIVLTEQDGVTKTSVWGFTPLGCAHRDHFVRCIAHREYVLNDGEKTMTRAEFDQALDQILAAGVSVNLPGPAAKWYLQIGVDKKLGHATWSLLNGTLTRYAVPTDLKPGDWKEVFDLARI